MLLFLFILQLVCLSRSFYHGSMKTRMIHKNSQLNMVFDFLRDRTTEGLAQVQNIATKTLEGKLGEALLDSAEYIKERNKIDAENFSKMSEGLAKSRERLLSGINGAFDSSDASFDEQVCVCLCVCIYIFVYICGCVIDCCLLILIILIIFYSYYNTDTNTTTTLI